MNNSVLKGSHWKSAPAGMRNPGEVQTACCWAIIESLPWMLSQCQNRKLCPHRYPWTEHSQGRRCDWAGRLIPRNKHPSDLAQLRVKDLLQGKVQRMEMHRRTVSTPLCKEQNELVFASTPCTWGKKQRKEKMGAGWSANWNAKTLGS